MERTTKKMVASGAYFIIVLFICNFSYHLRAQPASSRLKLNQSGFYPNAPKYAVLTGNHASTSFYITSTNLRDTFFNGTLSEEKQSAYSATKTRIANFSTLNKTGSFVVLVPGMGHSGVFEIGDYAHRNIAVASLKGYYYQRVSMPLDEKYAGKWHRSAGHPDDMVVVHASAASKERPEGTKLSSPGGWYDAGDYNKYIVNSGITMGTLLSAYEDFSGHFSQLETNIPESGNGIPDILDEVLYNLRWMLTMQDPNDGGVYNKCTNASFDGMVMPGVTKAPRYVVQKGTAATLDFAAVTAQASRVLRRYKKQLPGLSDSCLRAAKQAWNWALINPALEYNQASINQQFKPVISTGGYGDKNFGDEWLWAATELYCTTRDISYYEVAKKHLDLNISLPTWSNVGMLGYYTFLRFAKELSGPVQEHLPKLKDRVMGMANDYIDKVKVNAFGTVMGQSARDFNWGGNANAANQGILLIRAYLLSGDRKYMDFALSNLDYLMGRNATGYCFITGAGSRSPMFPHHRQSVADGITEPVPGLLAGGPNASMQDKCKYEFTEVETAYTDSDCSYASNEIAINWNAPLVYLSNAIEALQNRVGYSISR